MRRHLPGVPHRARGRHVLPFRPFAIRIRDYLKRIFDQGARADVVLEDDVFKGIEFARAEYRGAFAFDSLSGEIAAAVRLAIADPLAAEHDGSLPVVFGGFFAVSDLNRAQNFQRMLDLAANRELQAIVPRCNPPHYAGFGAKQTVFSSPPLNSPTRRSRGWGYQACGSVSAPHARSSSWFREENEDPRRP